MEILYYHLLRSVSTVGIFFSYDQLETCNKNYIQELTHDSMQSSAMTLNWETRAQDTTSLMSND